MSCSRFQTEPMEKDLMEVSPPDQEPIVYREVIDDKGDIILRSKAKEFQVSSKILVFASPYFETMFKPEFPEGRALRSSSAPLTIDLLEDNSEALTVLLHTIHLSKKRRYWDLDLDMQFEVAVLSDKYDCTRALFSDSQRWLMAVDAKTQSLPSLWKLAAVAYLMCHPVLFAEPARLMVRSLKAVDLEGPLPLAAFPDAFRG